MPSHGEQRNHREETTFGKMKTYESNGHPFDLPTWEKTVTDDFASHIDDTVIDSEQVPKIAHPDDIDAKTADVAFYWTSFTPENRGYLYREGYADAVNSLYEELWSLADSPEKRNVLQEEMEKYRQGYKSRTLAYLSAHSRCASPMITGPAKFPTERNRKRSNTADRRWTELTEWSAKARVAVKKKLLDMRSPEEMDDAAFLIMTKGFSRSLAAIGQIDRGESPYTRSAFTSSITGKLERLAKTASVSLVKRLLDWLKENNYPGGGKKPALSPNNGVWKLADKAEAAEAERKAAVDQGPELLAEKNGIELRTAPEDDRVRLHFPFKPSEEIRNRLKSSGWRWSPTAGAWQRKLTTNAIYAGKAFLETL